MGGCYSTAGHGAVTPPRHKQPKTKGSRHSKKEGHYLPVTNGGNRHYQDLEKESNGVISIEENLQVVSSDLWHSVTSVSVKKDRGVVPSDSGIESLDTPQDELNQQSALNSKRLHAPQKQLKEESLSYREYTLCHACHRNLQKINLGPCAHCGRFRIDLSELTGLVNPDTYCTCGPRQLGRSSTCRTHGVRVVAASVHRSSDFPNGNVVLKSNVKEERLSGGKRNHSSASVFINGCLDHAVKEASGSSDDKIRFRAPLARADSLIDKPVGGKTEGEIKCDGAFLASKVGVCHEDLDCICKCDHSAEPVKKFNNVVHREFSAIIFDKDQPYIRGSLRKLLSLPAEPSPVRLPVVSDRLFPAAQEEDDEDSGRGMSKSGNRSGSASDFELEVGQGMEEESTDASTHSSPLSLRLAAARVLETVPDDSEESMWPVTVNGRLMVMMDASTFASMLNDLSALKEQLNNLSQVIQEEEAVSHLDFSLQVDQ